MSNSKQAKPRDRSEGPTAGGVAQTLRRNALPLAGALAGAAAATAAAIFFTRRDALPEGHAVPELEGEAHPGPDDRADPHFRPDMDAPMSKADREALAPALGKPTLVAGDEV